MTKIEHKIQRKINVLKIKVDDLVCDASGCRERHDVSGYADFVELLCELDSEIDVILNNDYSM